MIRVLRYAFAQAKTRALKGRLLTAEDWHFILGARSRGEVLRYLAGTDYAEPSSKLQTAGLANHTTTLVLYERLFSSYAKLVGALPHRASQVILSLLLRFEAENLKTILRGIWQRQASADIGRMLYRLPGRSSLPMDQLLQAESVTDALERLHSTIFFLPLKHARAQFQAQASLFPLETAIDTIVIERLGVVLGSLRGRDRKGAQDLIGELIDLENLSWMIRFRFMYNLSPEEFINYLWHGGRRLRIQTLGALARTVRLDDFLAQLPQPYRRALQLATTWTDIQPLGERWLAQQLYRVFSRDPFQIRLPLAFLLLKEIEVRSLERIFAAWDMGGVEESLLSTVRPPFLGGSHV